MAQLGKLLSKLNPCTPILQDFPQIISEENFHLVFIFNSTTTVAATGEIPINLGVGDKIIAGGEVVDEIVATGELERVQPILVCYLKKLQLELLWYFFHDPGVDIA